MARKYSKGKKPEETMRQRQQRLLREQRARKAAQTKVKTNPVSSTPRGAQGPRTAPQQGPSQRTNGLQGTRKRTAVRRSAPKPEFSTSTKVSSKQKALPPGKKGGALATTKSARRRNINRNPSKGTQMGTRGSAKPQLRLPKATMRSAGAASKALSTTGKVAGRIALPISAYQTGKDLKDSLDRGEGYARVPGMVKRLVKGTGKNKTTGAKTNSRGRRVGAVPKAKTPTTPKKRGMSNIPPGEGTGKGSPNDKPTTRRNVTTPTAPTKSRKAAPKTAKQRAYAADSRNKEYDRLRKAGKIKEATALGKKIYEDKFGKKKDKPKAKPATGADAQNLRSGPKPPTPKKKKQEAASRNASSSRPTKPTSATKPKPARKPLAVDPKNIPKNLKSPAGRKYLADLDAGRLTRKRK